MVFLSKLGDLQKKKGFHQNSKVFFRPELEIQGFFSRPNTGDLQTNKKKIFTEIQRVFPAEIRNSRVCFQPKSETQGFFRPNAGDLQKKKVSTEIQTGFSAEIGNSRVFLGRMQVISNKKKGLHRLWVSSWTKKLHYFGPNNGKSFTTLAPKSFEVGAVFIFGAKIGLKSTRNVLFCIFFRPMGEARAPPPPLPLATLQVDCRQLLYTNLQYIYILSLCQQRTNPLL